MESSEIEGIARKLDRIIALGGAPVDTGRGEFLRATTELVASAQGTRAATLLWLWDPDNALLSLSRYYSNVTPEEHIPQLCRVTAARVDGVWQVGLRHQAAIAAWAEKHGLGIEREILPIVLTDRKGSLSEAESGFAGVLQILSNRAIPEPDRLILGPLARAFALLLQRSRDQRQIEALHLMHSGSVAQTRHRWLSLAAKTLCKITTARACVVFLQEHDRRLRALASFPANEHIESHIAVSNSLTGLIAQRGKGVRILDFTNPAERKKAFQTTDYDAPLLQALERDFLGNQPLRSWLAEPIVIASHSTAVVMLLNKGSALHLAETFSKTDELILQHVCSFLAGVLPGVQMYRAADRISRLALPDSLDTEASRTQLYDLLRDLVPGMLGAALFRSEPDSESPVTLLLGGEEWTSTINAPGVARKIVKGDGNERFHYLIDVDEYATLIVGLQRKQISGYEEKMLAFFCKEMSHVLRAERSIDEVRQQKVQMRHAVRAGLTGIIGNIKSVRGMYALYQRDRKPYFIDQPDFGESLHKIDAAAKKTQLILEESRFLIQEITRASLRVGSIVISRLIREVVEGLKFEAESRGIAIQFNNNLPILIEKVQGDHQLVELMVFNIIDNAIKYSSRDRDVLVTLGVDRTYWWQLIVSDFGTYIRPDDHEVIFRPFVRRPTGRAARTRPGTGVGLAVSRSIAEAHGGTIVPASHPIEDSSSEIAFTSFTVRIPRVVPSLLMPGEGSLPE